VEEARQHTAVTPAKAAMPTVLRHKGYRFFFYSNEGDEPAHVHVRKGDSEAKVWLHDLSVAVNLGYTPAS
jgi:hypothetical protein